MSMFHAPRGRVARRLAAAAAITLACMSAAACGGSGSDAPDALVIYSGREEDIVAPLIDAFEKQSGVDVEVRYGKSSELAAQLAEEGDNTPADVFFSQDAGTIGSVADRMQPLPQAALARVAAQYRSPQATWVGTSGRVRVVAYSTERMKEAELPDTVAGYAEPRFAARLGIAPSNASFQAFVSAMRMKQGDDATRTFLTKLKDNGATSFENNRSIVEAIADGDIDTGLVNHYYLALVKKERPDAAVANHFLTPGDPGALVNVAAVGVVKDTEKRDAAQKFVAYLLSDEGQRYYATAAENEYPLVKGLAGPEGLPSLARLTGDDPPLGELGGQEESTVEMIREVGLLS